MRLTRAGREPCRTSLKAALAEVPDLVRAGRHHVRPGAVRLVSRRGPKGLLRLADGFEYVAEWTVLEGLREALGLPSLDRLEPCSPDHRRLYDLRLRDYPVELLQASREDLERWFEGDLVRLLDGLVWQVYRLRQAGLDPHAARTHRGLLYDPALPVLARAGHLGPGEVPAEGPLVLGADLRALALASLPDLPAGWARESPVNRLHALLLERLDLFVGHWRLFTYRELGFVDSSDEFREVGSVRPEVVILAEKWSLLEDARALARLFGTSLLVLGGAPKLSAAEFLVEHLRPRVEGPVRIVSYCDFDPYGWHFPVVFARHLDRYGMESRPHPDRLVLPGRFTPEELDLLATPLHSSGPGTRTKIEEWVEESGGVGGRPLGLYADLLRPLERLVQAFRETTGLAPL